MNDKPKRFPEDVEPGDFIVPTPEGMEYYGLPYRTPVRMVSVIKVHPDSHHYCFLVGASRNGQRMKATELGSAWFTGFWAAPDLDAESHF